jgi:hypothetical protein
MPTRIMQKSLPSGFAFTETYFFNYLFSAIFWHIFWGPMSVVWPSLWPADKLYYWAISLLIIPIMHIKLKVFPKFRKDIQKMMKKDNTQTGTAFWRTHKRF